jgi:uracil-DNA glycosylase
MSLVSVLKLWRFPVNNNYSKGFPVPDNNWGFIDRRREAMLENIYAQTGGDIYPVRENVLRFLRTDFGSLKCVIVGMDPYPSPYVDEQGRCCPVATGRSFEVSNMSSWLQKVPQASARNILCAVYYAVTGNKKPLAEIRKEIIAGAFAIPSPHEWFDYTEKQGVLWLNESLTVRPGFPGSQERIWEEFMTELSGHIVGNTESVWMLWGNAAQKRFGDIVPQGRKIEAMHPRMQGFIDENPFSKIHNVKWT